MRFDKFTAKLQAAIAEAQSLAVGHGHNQLEPVHLLLALIDDHVGHGNLRHWAAFTHTAADLCARAARDRIDEEIVHNAFAVHGGVVDVGGGGVTTSAPA